MSTNPTIQVLAEAKSLKLNSEQEKYLEGFLAGLEARHRIQMPAGAAAAPITQPATTAAPPIFEERIKQELHPLDAYPLLLEHAENNQAPERENIFRFKWNGLFHLTPKKDGFMSRLRIPGGLLKSTQLREIARAADELADGFMDITTRANIQVRVIQPKHAPEFLTRIQNIGLHTRGSGADNIRNLTASPTFGIDPLEVVSVYPFILELSQCILASREYYDLPRKFNIAFDGGGAISALEDTNDIGFKAVKIEEGTADIPPGIYFRVQLGGITGHLDFARDCGLIVPQNQVVKTALALVKVFIRHGYRHDRKKARLKYLLQDWGIPKYIEETEKILKFKLIRHPAGPEERSAVANGHSHLGVHPQKQAGLNYIGVVIPVGRMLTRQARRLADIAEHYGSGELRLTVWQNLIIPNIPDAYVETVKKALVKAGFHYQASSIRGGLVACTGNAYCKYAQSDTKGHALELVKYLEKKLQLDTPINIHLTGCPHSCAQHYIGDIGLLGTKVKLEGESVDGYHVFVGGGYGSNQKIGRQVFTGISFQELPPMIEAMLQAYVKYRKDGETFQAFTSRHELNELQAIFSNDE